MGRKQKEVEGNSRKQQETIEGGDAKKVLVERELRRIGFLRDLTLYSDEVGNHLHQVGIDRNDSFLIYSLFNVPLEHYFLSILFHTPLLIFSISNNNI